MVGFGDILQGVGAVASIFGSGKEKVNTTPTSGYATLPQYLKDAYEQVYFPKVMEQFNQPFQMEPTVRYQEQDPLNCHSSTLHPRSTGQCQHNFCWLMMLYQKLHLVSLLLFLHCPPNQ